MTNDICDKIENDEFYKGFLSTFNEQKTNHSNQITETAISFTEQITKLTEGLDILSTELQSQVRQEHGALLSQASHAGKLSAALGAVSGHMERLQNGANRLKNQVNVPFTLLENQTRVLERLHDASHQLRQAGRFLQLFRKLQSTKDAVTQATLLYELEPLIEDPELNRIAFIREEKSAVVTTKQRLNNFANRDLFNGLKNGNEQLVITSLQIFSNLQTLSKCVDNILETFNADIKQSLKQCFAGTDISNLSSKKSTTQNGREDKLNQPPNRGPGKTPTFTTSQHFRSKLWTALEWLFDEEIYSYCLQIVLLQKCLSNIQQNNTICLNENCDIERRFWSGLETLLKNSFADAASHISQCLQQGLPKLLAAARGLQFKFGTKFVFGDTVFESLEAGYLEKCAINLKAPLIGTDCPTQDAVDNLIRAASSELSAAMVDNRLCLLVAGAFMACNSDFLSKIEANVKLGTDSQQVVDVPNASQTQNISLANTVYYHNELVKRMIENLGKHFSTNTAAEKIMEDLKKGKTLILAIIQQLIESMNSAVNIILLSMHREPGLNGDKPVSNTTPSLYMKELQDFLLRTWNLHIAPFADKDNIENCGKELSSRCIELFVRNVAIVRPISTSGRNRLKADCQHLESALKPIINNVTTLGRPYRLLHALSSLLTLTPEELSNQSTETGGPISPYIILFLLFGHAENDLISPHIAAGWSNEKLIQWLDGHTSDKERLELVTGALQKYRTIVRQKNIAQYDPVYPFISNYLEKVYKSM